MIRRPPRSTQSRSSAASDVYKRQLQSADKPLVLALDRLAVDHERNPLLEAERGNVGLLALLLQRLGHAGEPEGHQAVICGMREHRLSFRFLLTRRVLSPASIASVVIATTTDAVSYTHLTLPTI